MIKIKSILNEYLEIMVEYNDRCKNYINKNDEIKFLNQILKMNCNKCHQYIELDENDVGKTINNLKKILYYCSTDKLCPNVYCGSTRGFRLFYAKNCCSELFKNFPKNNKFKLFKMCVFLKFFPYKFHIHLFNSYDLADYLTPEYELKYYDDYINNFGNLIEKSDDCFYGFIIALLFAILIGILIAFFIEIPHI